jgi:hypothetical protein
VIKIHLGRTVLPKHFPRHQMIAGSSAFATTRGSLKARSTAAVNDRQSAKTIVLLPRHGVVAKDPSPGSTETDV